MCVRVRLSLDLPCEWFDAFASTHSNKHTEWLHETWLFTYTWTNPRIEARPNTELLWHFFVAKCWKPLLVRYVSCTSLEYPFFFRFFVHSLEHSSIFPNDKAATNKKIKMNFASITHYWVYGWISAIKICTPAVSIVRLYRFPHTHPAAMSNAIFARNLLSWCSKLHITLNNVGNAYTHIHTLTRALIVLRNTNKMLEYVPHKLCLREQASVWTPHLNPFICTWFFASAQSVRSL